MSKSIYPPLQFSWPANLFTTFFLMDQCYNPHTPRFLVFPTCRTFTESPLGRFNHKVAMSICVFVCASVGAIAKHPLLENEECIPYIGL